MKKKNAKKLLLHKTTLSNLDAARQLHIKGGDILVAITDIVTRISRVNTCKTLCGQEATCHNSQCYHPTCLEACLTNELSCPCTRPVDQQPL
jgi:hypothetical protein